MNIPWLFDTCGFIVGPAIMLAGLASLGLCLRASRASATWPQRRQAFVAAVSPVVTALLGVVFGLVVWLVDGARGDPSAALGKVILAGAVVAVIPLVWAGWLLRSGPGAVVGTAA